MFKKNWYFGATGLLVVALVAMTIYFVTHSSASDLNYLSLANLNPVHWLQEGSQEDQVESNAAEESVQTQQAAWLGVQVTRVHPALAAHLETVKTGGVMINEVVEGSPAKLADLRQFDIILKVDGEPIQSAQQLRTAISNKQVGDEVTLSRVRAGHEDTVKVKLAAAPVARVVDTGDGQPERRQVSGSGDGNRDSGFTWSESHTMTLTKDADGKYRLQATYTKDGNQMQRTFEGTKQEVLAAINDDDELPVDVKQRLRNSVENPSFTRGLANDWMKDFRRTWQSDSFFFNDDFFNDSLLKDNPFDAKSANRLIEQFEQDIRERLERMRTTLEQRPSKNQAESNNAGPSQPQELQE
jgi:hypothetical protein